MTRTAVIFDRLMALLAGLALTAAGGFLIRTRSRAESFAIPSFRQVACIVHQPWWPWASAGCGIVLILFGLRWLVTHHRSPKAARIGLPSRVATGSLSADVSSLASAAADSLRAQTPLLKASARATLEHGVPTLTLSATTPARRGLAPAATAADSVASTAALMAGEAIAVRTRLTVDTKQRRRNVL